MPQTNADDLLRSIKPIRKEYVLNRELGRVLTGKIFSWNKNKSLFLSTAGLLGMRAGNTYVMPSDSDAAFLMDAILFEPPMPDAPTLVQEFFDYGPALIESEDNLLALFIEAKASLFECKTAFPEYDTLLITDLFTGEDHLLFDINFSKYMPVGFVFYTRIINFCEEFYCTSGGAMPIGSGNSDKILNDFNEAKKKNKLLNHSRHRFAYFFRLFQKSDVMVEMRDAF